MTESGPGLSIRAQKVRGIINAFDSNKDGCLNRIEVVALMTAVNPHVKFNKEQIEAILDVIFKTYAEFIQEPEGLSFEGLLRTYDDGAGDLDRDFDALGLNLDSIPDDGTQEPLRLPPTDQAGGSAGSKLPAAFIADGTSSANAAKRSSKLGARLSSRNNGIAYDDTCHCYCCSCSCYCSCLFPFVSVAGAVSQLSQAVIQAVSKQPNTKSWSFR
ncbi:unnamed protein product [Sphagnum tenellum]